ncbi:MULTISPECIES: flagellar hook-associated protein FlgK [Deefgea]|uniref:Flagellar hook-associated protein 1 n=1 Tax=Deefgea chitinilytica TaxID=570276 RepID=A0ABS2CDC0_9NEIS|nr:MULTISPECIES: flagellar hook-associated protein FlgK [Deefgea]MBM5571371.1 flagellar hook-associated protein FlgK [Deefgea chitinilytica]MBM9888604.1 flagellar hook-associated protein FlgK [Deefgea sp. CFH1-16]
MASSVFGIGVSGLNAANLGLTTTGHNIANVNTDGFSRQGIRQSAPFPQLSGSGFNGLGVKVDSIVRVYDQFLTKAVEVAQTQSSYQNTRLSHLAEINNIVADPTAGVSPALQDFFSSVQNVATNPANPPSRQAMLSSAQTLVNRFQVFSQRLNEQRAALNGEISNTVSSINAYAAQVSDLNNKIVVAQSSGQPPNDLLDQRDLLVRDLNKLIKTTSLPLSDGSINLFVGNGQGLVVGSQTYTLGAVPNPADPESMSISYEQNGTSILLPDNLVSGGQLGALLDYRRQSLDLAQNSLERTALGMVNTFNQQHKAGQDLNGNLGQDFWSYPTTNLAAGIDVPKIGVVRPNANNTVPATASLTGYIQDISKLTTSNYELAYDGTNYTLANLSDGSKYTLLPAEAAALTTPAGFSTATGLSLSLTAVPAAGDRFTIMPLKGFIDQMGIKITDPREIAAAGPVVAVEPKAPAALNTGTLKITQPDPVAQTSVTTDPSLNPNLFTPVTLTFVPDASVVPSGMAFTVAGAVPAVVGNVPYKAGATISYNGWTMKLDGLPANGDSVTVQKNVSTASSDNRNALALGKLQTTRILDGNTATYQESYGRMVATVGTQTSEATIMSKAQDKLLANAESSRDSVSAVNLDEEAANLLRYQQAYQASSKVIQIAQKAFDEIVNLGR